jgi:hypothetical protein
MKDITNEGTSKTDHTFYQKVRVDDTIGYIFNDIADELGYPFAEDVLILNFCYWVKTGIMEILWRLIISSIKK